jgi:hypothetical protein
LAGNFQGTNFDREREWWQERLRDARRLSGEELLGLFTYQYRNNEVYRTFCGLIGRSPEHVRRVEDIPFLPIEAFKRHLVTTGKWAADNVFESSGTTGQVPSRHHVRSLDWYRAACARSFEAVYGPPDNYTWLALLPSYLERSGSSLVEMVNHFMSLSDRDHGFFLDDFDRLRERLRQVNQTGEPCVLIGVSFALLDFVERGPQPLSDNVIIMETGGMKGRRMEWTRMELHKVLSDGFSVKNIQSEYGMTELMQQAYAPARGMFRPAPHMHILWREITDPLAVSAGPGSGLLNVIDAANIDSCVFIATDDLVRVYEGGEFEVLGRSDVSEMRGCNLLYTNAEQK